jgi:hypothetical protein
LDTKKDAFSLELQQYCYSQPVVVIRGLAGALKLGKEEYVKLNIKIKFIPSTITKQMLRFHIKVVLKYQ